MTPKSFLAGLPLTVATIAAGAGSALATQPEPWEMGFQPAASPIMERILHFNDHILIPIIVGIAVFVVGLLIVTLYRFRASANPTPSRTTHNTLLEFAWTVIPVVILVVIAIPSIRLLYYSDTTPEAGLTIKAIGHQWYWSYEYPDNGGFGFDAVMLEDDALPEGGYRLLETDNRVVVPVDTVVRVLITAEDVIHAWAVPAFGVKKDAVPGRTTEVWFQATREGTYYGQCSELCGVNHGFMPIAVDVVSAAEFAAWVAQAQARFGVPGGDASSVAGLGADEAAAAN
jgi:cytochrome c oxidase subunit 2